MGQLQRVLLAVAIVVADVVVLVFPLAALFLAYIILANPRWFRAFLDKLNGPI